MRPFSRRAFTAACLMQMLFLNVPGTRADNQLTIGRSTGRDLVCESEDYRYRYCPADTRRGVRLSDELSKRNCVFQKSWGYDSRGVWVDRGCRARFSLDGKRPTTNDPFGGSFGNPHGNQGAGYGSGDAPYGGGYGHPQYDRVPSWAVGKFIGNEPDTGYDLSLTIDERGTVYLRRRGKTFRGRVNDEHVVLDAGGVWELGRSRSGIVLEGGRGTETMYFRRWGSRY